MSDLIRKLGVTRLGWLAYGLAVSVIVLDQLSKTLMLSTFVSHCPGFAPHPDSLLSCRIEVSALFDLTMVWNRGMSFGILGGEGMFGRSLLSIFAVVVAVLIGGWARKADKALFAWPAGLLMGGALGNVIDRFRFGAVVDFLDFNGLGFPWVFNLADSAITVGAALLLIEALWPSLRDLLDSRRENGN